MRRDSRFLLSLPIALCLAFVISTIATAPRATAYSDSPPLRRTGAPGENTCATCHNGGTNDGQGTFAIQDVPASYIPGQTYTVTVSLARAGQLRWGFELTSLFTSSGAAAGAITSLSALTLAEVSSGKTYLHQVAGTAPNDGTYAGTANGPVTWSFQWTAPAAGGGEVAFYACGVAADNSGDADTGDLVYTTSAASTEGATIGVTETTWGKIKNLYYR